MKSFTKRSLAILIAVLMVFSVMAIGITSSSAAAAGDKLYLTPNSNWTQSNARFAAYFFNNSTGKNTWVSMTAVEGEEKLYEVTIPDGTWPNIIFCRMNPSSSSNGWNNKWNQTKDLTIPTDDKNLYTVKSGSWDDSDNNQWSVYNPNVETESTVPAPKTYTVAGVEGLCGTGWDPANTDNDMTDNGDGTYTKVYSDVPAGTYEFKIVVDHDWAESYGVDGGQDNIEVTVVESATITITFDSNTNIPTFTKEGDKEEETTEPTPAEPKTVYFVNAEGWADTINVYAWNTDGENGSWPGLAMEKTELVDPNGNAVYSYTFTEAYENIIFNDGAKQTGDLTVSEGADKYYCAGTWYATLEEIPVVEETEPAPKTYTVAGVEGLCGTAWDPTNTDNDMTDEDGDGVFTKVYENVAVGTYRFKVLVNHDWAESYGDPNGPEGNVEFVVIEKATITITFDTNTNTLGYTKEGDATEPETEPTPKEYVLMGYINGANVGTDTDWENVVEDYKFVDGTVTVTFEENSYVAVKTTDNVNWYWAQTFCEDTTVTLYPSDCDEKMFVPGGVEVVFTLVENEDGTITLSYVLNGEIPSSDTTPEDTTPEDTTPSDTTPVATKTVKVGVIEWITDYVPTIHYWNDSMSGDAELTATGETAAYAVGADYWENAAQNFTIYTAEVPETATGMKTYNAATNEGWAAEEVAPADDQIILVFEWGNTYHNVLTSVDATVEPTEPDTTPEDTTPSETTPVSTKTVKVGVIEWITDYVPTVHYWNDSMAGDAELTATGETAAYAVGADYWENAAQNFTIYTAEVPETATGMKTYNAATNEGWAAEEVAPADGDIILVFEYDGSYHNVLTSAAATVEPTEPDTTPSTPVTHTYTVVGAVAPAHTEAGCLGTIWDLNNNNNDLTYDETTGLWSITYNDVAATGKTDDYDDTWYEYKVVEDHDWTVSFADENGLNYKFDVEYDGSTVKIFFDGAKCWAEVTAPETTPSEPEDTTPSETVKNGIVEENGGLYYYVNGVKTYAGLIMIDGYYYYVNSSCKVIAGKAYYISKTNLLLPSASYTFDETGKMVNPPAVEPDDEVDEDTVKNGLIREDGALVYYVDGVKTYGGLIQIDGDYYYVNSSCKAITGKAYYISKTNNYMERGSYTFDADGKMVK